MPELCSNFLFLCKKFKKSQQVLIFFFMWLYFQNVLFQLREQASRMRVLVIASGECLAVFSLPAKRNPLQSVLTSSYSVQNFSTWFVLFLWSAVPSWENTLSYRSPSPSGLLPGHPVLRYNQRSKAEQDGGFAFPPSSFCPLPVGPATSSATGCSACSRLSALGLCWAPRGT